MLRTTTLSAIALLALTLLAPTGAAAAGETCRGEAATMVGAPQYTITGTEGRDVVVTAGAAVVDTRGGDDLVCVTGGVETRVSVGVGQDLVDATAAGPAYLSVSLGRDADTFEGAAPTLTVWADDWAVPSAEPGSPSDVVRVGSLPGSRTTVVSGQPGVSNADVIRLAGSGDVQWDGPMAPGAELVGGDGDNRLLASLPAGDVAVDLGAGTAAGSGPGGAQELRWSGFESFYFSDSPEGLTDVDLTGSRGDDQVDLALLSDLRVTASMGRGDDVLNTSAVGAAGSSYDGGTGRDRLGVAAWGDVDLDLATGTLEAVAGGATEHADVSSFQDAHVWGRRVRIVGDGAANALTISGCRGSRVSGGGGGDRIRFATDSPHDGRACSRVPRARLDGGRGDDRVVGGPGADRLVGGPGKDVVTGQGGRDGCQGEVRRTCEWTIRG